MDIIESFEKHLNEKSLNKTLIFKLYKMNDDRGYILLIPIFSDVNKKDKLEQKDIKKFECGSYSLQIEQERSYIQFIINDPKTEVLLEKSINQKSASLLADTVFSNEKLISKNTFFIFTNLIYHYIDEEMFVRKSIDIIDIVNNVRKLRFTVHPNNIFSINEDIYTVNTYYQKRYFKVVVDKPYPELTENEKNMISIYYF